MTVYLRKHYSLVYMHPCFTWWGKNSKTIFIGFLSLQVHICETVKSDSGDMHIVSDSEEEVEWASCIFLLGLNFIRPFTTIEPYWSWLETYILFMNYLTFLKLTERSIFLFFILENIALKINWLMSHILKWKSCHWSGHKSKTMLNMA